MDLTAKLNRAKKLDGHVNGHANGHAPATLNGTTAPPTIIVARPFSEIVEEPVEWIWEDWLARGKFHLCAGVQGDGKSTILTDIAARLSSGSAMPDGGAVAKKRSGFLISEDGAADTVLPRLRIHKADLANILWLEAVRTGDADALLSLSAHLALLEQFITDNQLDLLIIDALSDFLGSIRRNDEGEVRSVLTPLAQMAGRTGCAIVGIVHLGKPGAGARRAVERVLGSGAFTQVARIVWAVSADPEDETRRTFGQVKNNIAPDPGSLAWHRDRDMPITWDGAAETSVRTMMNGTPDKTLTTDHAKTFLAEFLKGGGKSSAEVFEHGALAGIKRDPLYMAANALGVRKEKESGPGGRWYWRLPNGSPSGDTAHDDTPSHTPSVRYVSSGRYVSSEDTEVGRGNFGTSGTYVLPDVTERTEVPNRSHPPHPPTSLVAEPEEAF